MGSEKKEVYFVGYTLQHQFVITDKNVQLFAEATGDFNPVHFDKDYCRNTRFKLPIAHGLLSASVFSKVYGNIFPGEGSVYVSQTLEFKKPVYMNIPYQANFKVVGIQSDVGKVIIDCQIVDQQNVVLLQGQSVIYHEKAI